MTQLEQRSVTIYANHEGPDKSDKLSPYVRDPKATFKLQIDADETTEELQRRIEQEIRTRGLAAREELKNVEMEFGSENIATAQYRTRNLSSYMNWIPAAMLKINFYWGTQIVFRPPSGRTFIYRAVPSDTIRSVKEKVLRDYRALFPQAFTSAKDFEFHYNGKVLDSNATVASFEFEKVPWFWVCVDIKSK